MTYAKRPRDLKFDNEIAYASGKDDANRYMRTATGKWGEPWTSEAYNVAVTERNRIMDALYPGEQR